MADEYSKLTVKKLQKLLKDRGLKNRGRKAELVQRLKDDDAAKQGADPAEVGRLREWYEGR